jgi:hypothetical protein
MEPSLDGLLACLAWADLVRLLAKLLIVARFIARRAASIQDQSKGRARGSRAPDRGITIPDSSERVSLSLHLSTCY